MFTNKIKELLVLDTSGNVYFVMEFPALFESKNAINEKSILEGAFFSALKMFGESVTGSSLDEVKMKDSTFYYSQTGKVLLILKTAGVSENLKNRLYGAIKYLSNEFFHDVWADEQILEDKKLEKFKKKAEKIIFEEEIFFHARDIVSFYPENFVQQVIMFQEYVEKQNTPLRDWILSMLGFHVGMLLAQEKGISPEDDNKIKKIFNEFTISDVSMDTLITKLCPFCRGVHYEGPYCHFLGGMFVGMKSDREKLVARNMKVLHHVQRSFMEEQCIAKGDKTCSFKILWHI